MRLSIENDELVLSVSGEQKPIQSPDHLYKVLADICQEHNIAPEDLIVMGSSSFNWPEEYTDRSQTIKLCYELRETQTHFRAVTFRPTTRGFSPVTFGGSSFGRPARGFINRWIVRWCLRRQDT
jgi:hypothetical protein